ncbi:Crp/Fnr family transcriptional regulator [Vibrio sp. 10N]|uniref:Crp/Fnr family transcriptional regulator n=1 Tax=Vibrio sp. 10N TaxID=3058938 RepID=UPI00281320AE|nr:hypothetical protein VB10N_41440 [Vibrio sp. 10N]
MDHYRLAACDIKTVVLPKGKFLYDQHDEPDCFYFIVSGLVSLQRLLLNGKEVMSRVYKTNQYFGYRTLLSGQNYHVGAKALTDLTLERVVVRDFDQFFQENPRFVRYLFSEMATELRHAEIRLSKMSTHSVELRVIDSVIDLVTADADYKWTYREIAAYSGCSTETVIRVSKKLKNSALMHGENTNKSFELVKLQQVRTQLALGEKL